MQGADRRTSPPDSSPEEAARVTAHISLFLWEERLVAAFSGDSRLEALTQFGADFYERVSALCFHKPVQVLSEEERQLGSVLAHAGNYGLGKRYISGRSVFTPLAAQELLNQYYALFPRVRQWLKGEASVNAVQSRIEALVSDSLIRCVRKLPPEWQYEESLSFSMPSYIYEVQAVKFFRHWFEREVWVEGRMIRLPIDVKFQPSDTVLLIPHP